MSLRQVCRETRHPDGIDYARVQSKKYLSAPHDWILRKTFSINLLSKRLPVSETTIDLGFCRLIEYDICTGT